MLYFIAALYNEEDELADLISHVFPLVDGYCLVDDGSTDSTVELLELDAKYWHSTSDDPDAFRVKVIPHTGLPETVKHIAKEMVPDGAWILMLDADERLSESAIEGIKQFFRGDDHLNYDYVYFNQLEILDGVHVRTFQKAKLFRKEAVSFPLNNIHADDQFSGSGIFKESWVVLHRKTTGKQITREKEYLETYKKLLFDGHIDEGRFNWLKGLHHFVK